MTDLGRPKDVGLWIIDYASIAAPLQEISKPSVCSHPLTWSQEANESFEKLKHCCQLLHLGSLTIINFSYFLYMRNVDSVLTQHQNSSYRPVVYFSSKLKPEERGLPPCLKAVATTALTITKSADIVLGSQL